jgi:hypothetical protein
MTNSDESGTVGGEAAPATPPATATAAVHEAAAPAQLEEARAMAAALELPGAAASALSSHFPLSNSEFNFTNRILIANSIAEQIWREQQLVSNRMGWNFTSQGFFTAVYVFASSNPKSWKDLLIPVVLSVFGGVVAFCILCGVRAAQAQSDRLKRHWVHEFHSAPSCLKTDEKGNIDPGQCDIQRGAYPQPFSVGRGSHRGRYASRGVCYALMAMWIALLLSTVIVHWDLVTPLLQPSCSQHAAHCKGAD